MTDAFRQSIDGCLDAAIGEHGLTRSELAEAVEAAAPVLADLRARHDDGSLPMLRLPATRDDLAPMVAIAADWRRFGTVVVLGTGGSSLGGQALCALRPAGDGPRLVFLDNIDPDSFAACAEVLGSDDTGYLVISKSGGTAETLAQAFAVLPALGPGAARRALAITEPGDNPLRRLAEALDMPVLDHDPGIGGRYSALSPVGLLPAMIGGLDATAMREGAAEILTPVLAGAAAADVPAAVGAALNVAFARRKGASQAVVMAYSDRLERFLMWHRQLWAESLGKGGAGTTPVPAIGAVDQHSQLQLYLDGPADKLYTLIQLERAGTGPRISAETLPDSDPAPVPDWLRNRTMGDLLEAEQRATAATLLSRGRPVRLIRVGRLDARSMGAMMMHFMLETVIAGGLLGVDPFDQPAVEEGKRLARDNLAAMTGSAGSRG